MTGKAVDDSDDTQAFEALTSGSLVGHYQIIKRLGAGGMGEVYLATDTRLRRRVALKLLPVRFSADKELQVRFIREARAAAALNHPNIVTVHEVAEYKGRPFIAMEYVAGESIRDLMRRGPLSSTQALELMHQICGGLREAHETGIVHRDIKPSNIMIDRKGRCIILDFGLAKVRADSRETSPGAVIGTAAYMSPEQGQGLKADAPSDIFSLGSLFYEMLTGRSPFRRDGIAPTVYAVVHDAPEPLSVYIEGNTEAWQSVVDRMLAKEPAARYQSVADLMIDLGRLQTGETSLSPVRVAAATKPLGVNSLAVLCLRNLGPSEDEHLSYGITEDLIVDLTRVGTIRVAPMRSVLPFRDSDRQLTDIARTLDVSMVLDGSIHRSEDKLRASAQLIDVPSGKLLWADRWEDSFDRLHLIKRSLAEGVSRALDLNSSLVRAAQVGEPESSDPQAYEYYLRGKYAYEHRHSATEVRVASDMYDQALKLEPALLAAREGKAEILIGEGRHEEATQLLMSTLMEARERQQQADEARTLRLLAQCFSAQSLWADAARYAEQAVQVSKELGDLAGEAAALRELIDTKKYRADYMEALRLADRVLQINRQLNDRDKEAEALNLIGTVHLRQYECKKAMSMYREALSIATERDLSSVKAASITNIGSAYFYLGDLDQAFSHYEESMQIFSALGEATKQAVAAQNLAGIQLTRGAYRKALELYERALSICTKHHDQAKCVLTLNNIAHVLVILGRYDEAEEKLQQALRTATDIGYTLLEALAHTNLGMSCTYQGRYDQAAQELESAMRIAEQSSLRRVLAITLFYLGELKYFSGDRDNCYDYFTKAQDLAQEVGDKQISLQSRAYLVAREANSANYDAALDRQREIVEESERASNPTIILAAKRLLAESKARYGISRVERHQGIAQLRDLISYAREKEIAYEIQWLKSMLAQLG